MIEASCHCGAVRLEIERAPEALTDCNCSICRRYGALWAYYAPAQVHIVAGVGATETYMCNDRMLDFHRCKDCGCVSHWARHGEVGERMGVNARLMDLPVVAAARVRRLDGADTWEFLDE